MSNNPTPTNKNGDHYKWNAMEVRSAKLEWGREDGGSPNIRSDTVEFRTSKLMNSPETAVPPKLAVGQAWLRWPFLGLFFKEHGSRDFTA